jgi:hypothetical protein
VVRQMTIAMAIICLPALCGVEATPTLDIVTAADAWETRFILNGTKTEPTYIEQIRLERDGDLFILEGGAPAGMAQSRASVFVDPKGLLQFIDCPNGMSCETTETPTGFLASAVILAALRQHRLFGRFPVFWYGGLALVCIPADRLGVENAVLDPCVEAYSGAVIAQRHRRSGEFDGPSLDPWSIELLIASS